LYSDNNKDTAVGKFMLQPLLHRSHVESVVASDVIGLFIQVLKGVRSVWRWNQIAFFTVYLSVLDYVHGRNAAL
jgi:hypothetical protein